MALMCSVMAWGANQAKIGEMEYATLSGALAAAQDGDEVLVLENVTWSGGYQSVKKAITLNLNGYTLQSTDDETTAHTAVLTIFPGAGKSVIVKNGTIKSSSLKYTKNSAQKSKYVVWAYTGDITLQDLNVSGADYAVYNNGGANVTMEGNNVMHGQVTAFAFTKGSITIKDGVYSGSYGVQVNASASVNVTMEGGTINATQTGVLLNGNPASTFTLEGGTINAKNVGVQVTGTNSFTMNGGEINVRGENNFPYGVRNYGTTTINDGNITAITTVASYTGKTAVYVDGKLVAVDKTYTPWANAISGEDNSTTIVNGGYLKAAKDEDGLYSSAIAVWTNASLTITNGTIESETYGITGNGGYSGTSITITGGSIISNIGGIYHPQGGNLVIKGNPVVKAQNAIQLCAGVGMTGSITGGRFEAYGEDYRATKTGDGFIPDGAALSIVNRSYPGGMPTFAINGGTFLAQHQDAILAYTWDNSQAVGAKHSTWAEATSHLSIREGIFSSDPTAYVPASGYTVTELDPTPTVYNHDEVVYSHLWQVGEESHVQSYDFTEAEVEYVEISSTTPSEKLENKTYTLNEDQSSKKVGVAENYTLVVAEDKQLNIGTGGLVLEDNAKLVVEPGAVVTVGTNGIINANGTENLVLETSSEKQAALLIDPDVIQNTQPLATVTIHTAARQKSANPYNYIWEYFACPVQEITDANKPTNNFDAAVQGLYAGEDHFITGVYTWGGNDWALVSSWKSLVPFKGYQLTNNSANGGVDYTFKGNLMGNGDGTYEFTTNGYGYFGNSYTAPIVISNFLGALDNSVYERTVWLYDAGADTYVSVNPLAARLGSAKYKDGTSIKEIRSLQAFILNKKADGAAATVNYRDAIWNNPRINSLAAPAPARYAAEEMQWSNIYVAANGKKEMVTLIEGTDFSNEFDNGADAGKYINNNSMNLYAATNDGKQAIVATDNLENTILSFQAGDATEYTLSFENGNENYMLRDNVTGAMVAIAEGGEYTFTQAANTTNPARFEVVAIAKVPTAIENVEEAAKATGIYTITGQYMGRDFTVLPAGVYVVNGVKVVK